MHVVATAGHVDHGKSTLVRALTGMEPDRWAEERRRGMTIDLGFAWTTLAGGEQLAFVDVPGHERFVPNMLAGVGPVPAALLVVAADEGWMPQTEEHVAVLDALGIRHAVLAVTRADLADPGPVLDAVRRRLAGTSLAGLTGVAVSAPTGRGLDELRAALRELVARLPVPDADAPVRLWVDRAFTIRGSGTVVTGTLSAGTLATGAELTLCSAAHGSRPVRVRGLQSLGRPVERASAVARVAVNLRGVDRDDVRRGDALLAPGRWSTTELVDVHLPGGLPNPTATLVLHLGSAAVPVRVRPLGERGARLALRWPLPLAAGDVALLRDPGRHEVVGRLKVLDTDPPPLLRRGAAAARGRELAESSGGPPDGTAVLRRRGVVRAAQLRATGATEPAGAVVAGAWLVDPALAERLRARLAAAVLEHRRRLPLEPGPTVEAVRAELELPDRAVVVGLVAAPLAVRDGRVVDATAPAPLPAPVAAAVERLLREFEAQPFGAPDAGRLAELGLGRRELAAAERAGALLRVADGVVLPAGAELRAARILAEIPQPFTLSEARQALGTTRRVAVPLLELLDRRRLTRRLPDDRRTVDAG
ncbi:selenocysteine-specific translation elongation factor [Micromonospora sp. NPDC049559]|uniref:selenocysteine-specific translation elongation factor n=1 Tax=Micromonospora sp. NPDC049559 TaxID=3155923 RepID=UPI003416ADBC